MIDRNHEAKFFYEWKIQYQFIKCIRFVSKRHIYGLSKVQNKKFISKYISKGIIFISNYRYFYRINMLFVSSSGRRNIASDLNYDQFWSFWSDFSGLTRMKKYEEVSNFTLKIFLWPALIFFAARANWKISIKLYFDSQYIPIFFDHPP